MKTTIAERLLQHFANGGEVSIYNMRAVWITNPGREVTRNFEDLHNIRLVRTKQHKPTGGTYINYSVAESDLPTVKDIWLKSLNRKA